MAFPTVPDHLIKDMEKIEPSEKIARGISKASKRAKDGTNSLVDSLILLIIVFLYFLFTGLALLLGRKLPAKWMKIGYDLEDGKVSKKINEIKTVVENKRPPSYKVVDLETNKPLGLKVESLAPKKKT